MLGLLLIFFLAKWYYDLAKKNNKKNSWLYGLLAVVIFYGFVFIGALVTVIVIDIFSPATLYGLSDLAIGLTGLPFGILAVWGGYVLLKRNFKKSANELSDPTIIDSEFDDLE